MATLCALVEMGGGGSDFSVAICSLREESQIMAPDSIQTSRLFRYRCYLHEVDTQGYRLHYNRWYAEGTFHATDLG